jgi:hypothetical protein
MRLSETVCALHVTIVEDKPAHGATVLVDQLDNQVTDLLGILEETDVHIQHSLRNSTSSGQIESVRLALNEIHVLINRFTAQYTGEVSTHGTLAKLLEMGRERGREWREWSLEVKTAVERCKLPAMTVIERLPECWNELAQRMAQGAISMQTTSIGQQITVRDDQLKVAGSAG